MTTPDILAARQLEKSGMTRSEAEAVVGLMRTVTAPLATNAKVEALGESLREEMKAMDESIREEMKAMDKSIREEMKAMDKSIREEMKAMGKSIRKDMISTEGLLRADMKTMESRLLWKMAGMNLTTVGLIIAAMRLFPP